MTEAVVIERDDLKPCPFCGTDPVMRVIPAHEHHIAVFMGKVPDTFLIECPACPAGFCSNEAEPLVKSWNTRTQSTLKESQDA